jgi:hypothetical protein
MLDSTIPSVDELWEIPEETLEQMLEDVAPEDLDFMRRRWRATLNKHNVTEDAQESQLARTYLDRYVYEGLIPAGKGWVKLSPAQRAGFLEEPEIDVEAEDSMSGGFPRFAIIGAAALAFVIFLWLISRAMSGGKDVPIIVVLPTLTVTATPTPVATQTLTPTPLALVDSDRFVGGGERSNRTFYPVLFTVDVPGDSQPRVFVVQEQVVNTSEWHYESNPDVASWVSGMSVRPVIGIPFSDSNADLMQRLTPETTFTMRMNTGAELRFQFTSSTQVGRQDTTLFQQREPGLALVLIGETDQYGAPTQFRPVALAAYLPEQELEILGEAHDLPTPTPHPTAPSIVDGLDVQLRAVHLDERNLYIEVRFFNPQPGEVTITVSDLWATFGFVSNPKGVHIAPTDFEDRRIPSRSAVDTTVQFAWNGSDPFATLNLAGWSYAVTLLGG